MTEVRMPISKERPLDAESAMLGSHNALDSLCRSLADVLSMAPRTPSRVSVRFGNASVVVEWPNGAGSAAEPRPPMISEEPSETAERRVLTAPLVGTFYRAPEPGLRPFVEVGDMVQVGDRVAIIEAMKLMNPVVAEHAGRVLKILVDNDASVEYGQPLLVLDPMVARDGAP